ncbi:putative amidoligase domain-containing protein [Brevibacillus sp. SYSU BS000544]|uniref:putative amidoligase domain-containing protein n=1 Tax=Brevibacillus sp. SYSU BS000544 TaxID=3416443 RepID=UPI003CE48A72
MHNAVLRLHGIPASIMPTRNRAGEAIQSEPFIRRYLVFLDQYKVLGIERMDGNGVWLNQTVTQQDQPSFEAIEYIPEDLELKRVVTLAIRSIYALGFDFGVVAIGVHSQTRMSVLEVSQEINDKSKVAWKKGSLDMQREQASSHPHQVMLGADPEFALRDANLQMGIASRYLDKQGVIGHDAARLRGEGLQSQHPLVELRPDPSPNPREVFRHLLQAMRKGYKKIPANLEWIAGGMPFWGYPIGGHIHFSGVPLSFDLLHKLDSYLALPLTCIEDEGCKKRRPRYGFLGDFREQPYGGFEYRTLPSWLVSPEITQGVLALAKLIASTYNQLTQHPLQDIHMQRAYYQGDKSKLRPLIPKLWQELKSLAMYKDLQIELDAFYQTIQNTETWDHQRDIRIAWGLLSREKKSVSRYRNDTQQPYRTTV